MNFINVILLTLLCISFEHAYTQNSLEKEKAIQKYREEYLSSVVNGHKDFKWEGSIEKCHEGQISIKIIQRALLRINYFRTLCGLKPIVFTNEFNKEAQLAAFIIYVNNTVSHDPDKSWKCYSENASLAAGHCSLTATDFIYHPETSFITGFIRDHGSSNDAVGHRRSLMFSRAEIMGYGATPKTEAVANPINKLGKGDSLLVPKYFSYPTNGYNEIDLLFPRWSFSIPDVYKVNWKGSSVEMRDDTGKIVNVKILPRYDIYDPTIVWEITDRLKRDYYLNHIFTVSIKNVTVNGTVRNHKYDVQFFDYVSTAK